MVSRVLTHAVRYWHCGLAKDSSILKKLGAIICCSAVASWAVYNNSTEKTGMKRLAWLAVWLSLLSGVSSGAMATGGAAQSGARSKQSGISVALPEDESRDPHESLNRRVFGFNAWLVEEVVDPTAARLVGTLPEIVVQVSHNIYDNLVEPEFIVSNLFVGDYSSAGTSTARFLINSTLGVLGAWDAAGWMGYHRTEIGFVESLCVAGLVPGSYVVLPAVGPAVGHTALLITGFFAVEWYLLAHISPTLATADLVVDISASAASLRGMRDIPGSEAGDPYRAQRNEYLSYIESACAKKSQKVSAAPH